MKAASPGRTLRDSASGRSRKGEFAGKEEEKGRRKSRISTLFVCVGCWKEKREYEPEKDYVLYLKEK